MLSDALSSGKKVYIVPIKKIKTKINSFTKIILKKKMAKLFNGKLENWKYKKLSETNQVCKKLIKFLNL
jgi:mitochondrial fission protein ELM1